MVVVVKGEGGARMALQVPPHYSLGAGALRRSSNPDLVYSMSKNNTQKNLLKNRAPFFITLITLNRDPFFITLIHFMSHEE